jgi:UDP-N-acetylmuramate--alanine ligase
MVTVVTNIEADHMDTYGGDFARLRQTFTEFLHNLPFYGLAVLCADDPVLGPGEEVGRPLLRYGLPSLPTTASRPSSPAGLQTRFRCSAPRAARPWRWTLNMPGRHNVLNATAAVAVATDQGIDDAVILDSLALSAGVGRRFSVYATLRHRRSRQVTLVDDYGHHPTEVAATLASARQAWPDRRLVMVYQPHRYTRTRDLYDDFVAVLATRPPAAARGLPGRRGPPSPAPTAAPWRAVSASAASSIRSTWPMRMRCRRCWRRSVSPTVTS